MPHPYLEGVSMAGVNVSGCNTNGTEGKKAKARVALVNSAGAALWPVPPCNRKSRWAHFWPWLVWAL